LICRRGSPRWLCRSGALLLEAGLPGAAFVALGGGIVGRCSSAVPPATNPAPKGRQDTAWGVSPRSGATMIPSPEGAAAADGGRGTGRKREGCSEGGRIPAACCRPCGAFWMVGRQPGGLRPRLHAVAPFGAGFPWLSSGWAAAPLSRAATRGCLSAIPWTAPTKNPSQG
jgi:hypothetical protein